MFNKYKKLIVIATLIALAMLVFFYIKGGENKDTALLIQDTTPTSSALLQDIRHEISQINSIKLDTQIFSSSILKSLEDNSKPITNEPIGRRNPFETLLSSGSVSNTDTGTTTGDISN